ncbi:hypothetical protein JKF63_04301 [Porcisia hertigi]|uniref:Uncharacterized protein n=1 Tax=Porcisia hertigi TaxID=2761500 RepID=A0A836L856_9TRYP|nr:hypothetical protein JKF63_04301 [Porcisia hertigi]
MRLHRRSVLLLGATLRRTAGSAVSSSSFAAGGAVAESFCSSPQPRVEQLDSTFATVDGHAVVIPASPQPHLHNPLLQERRQRAVYGREGFGFIERFRVSGPGAGPERVQVSLTIHILAVSVALLYVVYYFTTTTYVLTTDPSPHRNSLFFHFPCDMAIVENRLTRERRTVEVVPAAVPSPCPDVEGRREEDEVCFARLKPAIVECRLPINLLLHRVFLYLQKTNSLVMVDAQAEMQPYRFVDGANSLGRDSRPSVGFLRKDTLLLDSNQDRVGTGSSQRRWWGGEENISAVPSSPLVTNSDGKAVSSAAVSTEPKAPTTILLESSVRLRDASNGYQKGHMSTYEQLIRHIAQKKIKERFYARILERGIAKNSGLRKIYAEELIRNGLLSGDGVTLTELVTDLHQFAEEVFSEVKVHFGDDVIVYDYIARMQ